MRHLVCAALFLLAGCTGPNIDESPLMAEVDPVQTSGAQSVVPPVVAYFNTSYDNYTGAYLVVYEVGLGTLAKDWDATEDLALPRPMGSLLFEMRCQQTGGFAYDLPGYDLSFDVADGDEVVLTYASGDMGDCDERIQYDRIAQPRPRGSLVAVEFGSDASELNHEASFDVQFAISWFDADIVPPDHSVFP